MDKQEVADWYMETFADKTLSFGCIVLTEQGFLGKVYNTLVSVHTGQTHIYFMADGKDYNRHPRVLKTIGCPLTRGRLYQEAKNYWYTLCVSKHPEELDELQRLLNKQQILDKTIYERVENKEVLKILIDIKKLYGEG